LAARRKFSGIIGGMNIREIKNHHVARAIFILLGVLICLGALFRYIDRGNPAAESGAQNEQVSDGRTIPPHTALVTVATQESDKTYFVDLALTPAEREKGLGDRTLVGGNDPTKAGMLFVFDEPDQYGFWMKDTLIPLDMIWISADKTIIHIAKNVQPESYPTIYQPDEDALYVLELAGGQAEKDLLAVGQKVSISAAEIH
jgi:uncharacterized membrane protein (UPF0127 family)